MVPDAQYTELKSVNHSQMRATTLFPNGRLQTENEEQTYTKYDENNSSKVERGYRTELGSVEEY